MASQNSVDWAKAAAAWASQRQKMQQDNKQPPDARPAANIGAYPQMLSAMNYSAASAMTPNSMMMIPGFSAAAGGRGHSHYALFHPAAMGGAAAMYAQLQQQKQTAAHHQLVATPIDNPQASYPSWYLNSSANPLTVAAASTMRPLAPQQQQASAQPPAVPLPKSQPLMPKNAMTCAAQQTAAASAISQSLQQQAFTFSKPPIMTQQHQQQKQAAPASSASISQPPLLVMQQQQQHPLQITLSQTQPLVTLPTQPPSSSQAPSQMTAATTNELSKPLIAAPDLKHPSDNLDELVDSAGITDETVNASVKKTVAKVLSTVTDSFLETFSKEILTEIHAYPGQHKDRLTSGVHSQNRSSVAGGPPVLLPSQNTHALQLQLSFAARPVQPVLLGEAGLALEEDHDDLREDEDNNNLPFIVPEAPTKGLFRSPPEGFTLLPEENLECREQTVRVVCYTRRGKPLGEIELNGRQTIIFGSNSRQANIIDSHPSVYSQHCAIGVCGKPPVQKPAVVPCSLFLFPLGGTTKLYNPEQIPFLQPPAKEEEEAEDKVPTPAEIPTVITELPTDVIVDGDRKRKIPPGKQVFLQLSSSQRYYMIDASCWKKTHVMLGPDSVPSRFYSSESLERLNSEQSTDAPATSSPASLGIHAEKSSDHHRHSSRKKRDNNGHHRHSSRSPRRAKRSDNNQRDSSVSSDKRERRRRLSSSRRHHSSSRYKRRSMLRGENSSRKRDESSRKREASSSRRRKHKRRSSRRSHSTPKSR